MKWNYVDTFWNGGSDLGMKNVGDYIIVKDRSLYNNTVYYKRMS